jgi:hypothetical protein
MTVAVLLGPLAALHAADVSEVPQTDASAVPWKLLFSNRNDLADTWGKLHIAVTPVRLVRECEPPGFMQADFKLPKWMRRIIAQAGYMYVGERSFLSAL